MTKRPGTSRPGQLTIVALLLLAATATAQLGTAHAKLLSKAEKAVAKAEAKLTKLETKEASTEDALDEAEAEWDDTDDLLTLLEGLLAVAEEDLEDALALPESTAEEQAIKAAAVSLAAEGVDLARKEVTSTGKQLAKIEKQIEKLENKLDKLFDKILDAEDAVDEREAELDVLVQPFDYRLRSSHDFDLDVTADGLPLQGALVVITDTLPEPKGKQEIESLGSARVFWRGTTDADGSVQGAFEVPLLTETVDVIVVAHGHDGPWTLPEHRSRSGPFAPASRQSFAPGGLKSAEIPLTTWVSTPMYATGPDLDDEQLATLGAILPAVPQPFAPYLADDVVQTIRLDAPGTVDVTFVWEDGDQRHALGWFRFEKGPIDVLESGLVFDDTTMDPDALMPGDTVTITDAFGSPRVFDADTNLGFFLVADGAKSKEVKSFDPTFTLWPYEEAEPNGEVAEGLFSTLHALNPEQAAGRPDLAPHTALMRLAGFMDGDNTVVLGFEASARTSDHCDSDFNDLVVLVTPQSYVPTGMFNAGQVDPDADGIEGPMDAYPFDAERTHVLRVPSQGFGLTLLDDPYPDQGDLDFNDAVLAWAFRLVTDVEGDVKDVFGEFHLVARGNDADHVLVLHMPGLPLDADGTFDVERFWSNAAETHVIELGEPIDDMILSDGRRIFSIQPSTAGALPPLGGQSPVMINTEQADIDRRAASSRLLMTFDDAVSALDLGLPPYDLHWIVSTEVGQGDVHPAGVAALEPRPTQLPTEAGDDAFHDDEGWPWLLHLPYELQRFPLEQKGLTGAFPKLLKWAASHGQQKPDWPAKVAKPRVSLPVPEYLKSHDWLVEFPTP